MVYNRSENSGLLDPGSGRWVRGSALWVSFAGLKAEGYRLCGLGSLFWIIAFALWAPFSGLQALASAL